MFAVELLNEIIEIKYEKNFAASTKTQTFRHLCSPSPVFSSKVFGVFWLLMMSISWPKTNGMYGFVSAPNLMLISPIAHVALLQTEMYSGFKLFPRIGKKSAM